MEKSSEKVIMGQKLVTNPFNNLLSEVQLKINQPKSSKKIENYVLQLDSQIDKSNSNLNYFNSKEQKKKNSLETQSKKSNNNVYIINAPLKTKNSSDTLSNQQKERQIITQWIIGYMGKRNILGIHWEHNLEQKGKELLNFAFNKIKYYKQESKNEDSFERKILKFTQIFQFVKIYRKRQGFQSLKQFYKDDQLFGLSNTIKQQKNNSSMLKIESDYEALSISSPKFKKQPKKQYFGSSSSSCNNVTKKKISESADGSQDLSALILNHNKLKLSEQLNRSTPNIPKSKNSQKSIKTHKQIAELSLQTKKIINSQRKLSDQHKDEDLPLQSNKQLKKTKKQLMDQQTIQNTNIHPENSKDPVTITFVLKNLHLTSLINSQQQKKFKQNKVQVGKHSIHEQIKSKERQSSIKQIEFDQNVINKLPFTQSFYQPIHPKNGLVTFIQPQNPKRSTSLQVKYNNPIQIQKNEQNIFNNMSNKHIFNQEYYPEENNRENQHFINNHIQLPIQKVRPKSATPKITFTFSNSTSNLLKNPIPSSMVSEKIIVSKQFQHPQYDQQDCVLQSIINSQPVQILRQVQVERKHNKLQIISPSRKPESPKRVKIPPTKMVLNHRQHIKNIILPASTEYYDNEKSQRPSSNIRYMFKDNQLVYNDHYQQSTAQNSLFSPRESNSNRLKSPKDKIFVTYLNNRNV